MKVTKHLLTSWQGKKLPNYLMNQEKIIEETFNNAIIDVKNSKYPIYGVTTLVGHYDNILNLKDDFSDYLIDNHAIGSSDFFDKEDVDLIGLIKAHQVSMGGIPISLSTYKRILKSIYNNNFDASVPKYASYSSGDVIPASHWAKEIIEFENKISLTNLEGISLINGNFIQIGVALSLLYKIDILWCQFLLQSRAAIKHSRINPESISIFHVKDNDLSLYNELFLFLKEETKFNKSTQDPVSFRATPQVLISIFKGFLDFANSIENCLNNLSCNPLYNIKSRNFESQGSFLAVNLSIKTHSLFNIYMLAATLIEKRVHYLFSGKHGIYNQDFSDSVDDPLGFVQLPKIVSGLVNEIRLRCSPINFSSVSNTSNGIEDMSTSGLSLLNILLEVNKFFNLLLEYEFLTLQIIESQNRKNRTHSTSLNYKNKIRDISLKNKILKKMRYEIPNTFCLY